MIQKERGGGGGAGGEVGEEGKENRQANEQVKYQCISLHLTAPG